MDCNISLEEAMKELTETPTAPKNSFRNKDAVSNFIRSLLEHGFNRAEIASACNVSRLTICAWEVGEMKPNRHHADILEELFNGLMK